jgi:transcriptional regulator with XRE-family HTH domain
MANSETGSTVPRRQLGRELRKLREAAGVTVQAIAEALEWSGPRIWRIEHGKVAVRAVDVRVMCEVYRADQETTEALMALARQTKSKGWWHAYGDSIPDYFELYVGLEAAATRLRTYDPELVNGLFQTHDYAAEVFRVANPGWSDEEVERAVTVRLERQRLLTRPVPAPLAVDAILNEAVLRRASPAQLACLAEVSHQPNVTIRVLPFAAGLHPAAMGSGAFTLLYFPEKAGRPTEPTTVYCADGLTGALYLDQPWEVETYETLWQGAARVTMAPKESRAFIGGLAEEGS